MSIKNELVSEQKIAPIIKTVRSLIAAQVKYSQPLEARIQALRLAKVQFPEELLEDMGQTAAMFAKLWGTYNNGINAITAQFRLIEEELKQDQKDCQEAIKKCNKAQQQFELAAIRCEDSTNLSNRSMPIAWKYWLIENRGMLLLQGTQSFKKSGPGFIAVSSGWQEASSGELSYSMTARFTTNKSFQAAYAESDFEKKINLRIQTQLEQIGAWDDLSYDPQRQVPIVLIGLTVNHEHISRTGLQQSVSGCTVHAMILSMNEFEFISQMQELMLTEN